MSGEASYWIVVGAVLWSLIVLLIVGVAGALYVRSNDVVCSM
jgi:uncharacterized membrane protein